MSFCLIAGLLVVGVFALKTANFEVGGNIVYNVNGAEMTIQQVGLNNIALADGSVGTMEDITVENSTTKESIDTMFKKWQELSLATLGKDGETSILVKITNNATAGADNYLDVNVTASSGTAVNCNVTIETVEGFSNAMINPKESRTFKISFIPEDDGYMGSLTGFKVNFDIQKKKFTDLFAFTPIDSTTASVKAIDYTKGGEIAIPSTITLDDGNTYTVTTVESYAFVDSVSVSQDPNYSEEKSTAEKIAIASNYSNPVERLYLPSSVTTLSNLSIAGLTTLKEINIPENLGNMEGYFGLSTFPQTIVVEGAGWASMLTSENVGAMSGLMIFGQEEKIYVPEGATVGDYVTSNFVKTTSDRANYDLYVIDTSTAALAYNYDDTNLTAEVKMVSPTATKGKVVVPESVEHNGQNYTVTSVADFGFYDEKQFLIDLLTGKVTDLSQISNYIAPITSITLPNTVTKIGEDAFEYNTSLMSVSIPNSVTYIGDNAFAYNSVLSSVSIPDTLEYVGDGAFRECSSLPKTTYYGIEYLGNATNPYVLALDVDNSTSTNFSIHENCKGIINNDSTIYSLGSATVSLPDGLIFIGDNALRGLRKISKLPESLKYLGMHNFYYDSSISYTTYGNAYYLGNNANPYWVLMKATSADITSVDINSNCMYIADNAFMDCTSLASMTSLDNVKFINEQAFMGCTNLSGQLDLRNANKIGQQAFDGCENITSLILSNKLGVVNMYAFNGCTSLTDVYFMGTEEEWNSISFHDDGTGLEGKTVHYNYVPE